ncbi:oxaloacetate decarboxylase alpha subunit/pyruvate carboxylase subunit B [Mariniflexile fucanivorans]|uniref:Oxaloacetate decarboxylase alpha subunit/pyruvate carboxylase subunit B n=1 Tax=Mariniflexile fucanivorans TaxID=264023 RepID=A0A4R1RLG8_9FLAO|nr:pyruvate carboxylase subunit B [Mariniflexile fucanivorans]TCL66889.1 oxaloacetate decarboxylase alpha subunit/pyruvate carboxylase subunit B [Mariniflexile fucanivorans]
MIFDKHGALQMTKMDYSADRPKAENPIKIQDLSFRDGHQSLFATRGRTEDMIPFAEQMDEVGFHAIETWGGATFDTMHRYLGEDPWERLRTLKKYMPKTPFFMLLRGQNVVGYRNYADDVVDSFVQRACDNGMDIFRCFDALNDYRNFETAAKVVKRNGKHFQGTICYTLTEPRLGGDVYNIDYYLNKAKELMQFGVDSICIKDMAGLIAPYDIYNLVVELKKITDIPINLHTHFTSGMGDLAIFKAIEAGVDIVDTCMAPYAYRTSHAAIEPLVISLLGTNRDTGLDIKKLTDISAQMEKVIPKYKHLDNSPKYSIIDTNVILHQTPGGMLSNLVNQLKSMDALDRLDDVFRMLPKVRKDLGQIPLVTPTSQIVGVQTVNNVLFDSYEGEYSRITQEVKDLCYGLYGKTTLPINPELRKKALKDYPRGEQHIEVRPGSILEPEMAEVKETFKDLAKDIDDEVLLALYPVTGKKFLKIKYGIDEMPEDMKAKTLEDVKKEEELIAKALSGELKAGGGNSSDIMCDMEVLVDGESFTVSIPKTKSTTRSVWKKKEAKEEVVTEGAIIAPIPGMIVEFNKKNGDVVKAGEIVVVLEAMKMMNNFSANKDGVISGIKFESGDTVAKGDILFTID